MKNNTKLEIEYLKFLEIYIESYKSLLNHGHQRNVLWINDVYKFYDNYTTLAKQKVNLEQFKLWFQTVIKTDKYTINLMHETKINQYVAEEFKISEFDTNEKRLYFIDRFQPDYHFDYDHLDQIQKQIRISIKTLNRK